LDSAVKELPYMLYSDRKGKVYEHPYYRMAGFSGSRPIPLKTQDLMAMPEFSKLFYMPYGSPIGLDPSTGEYQVVKEVRTRGSRVRCFGVAAFLEPGLVRSATG
jgi:hypothetical protein